MSRMVDLRTITIPIKEQEAYTYLSQAIDSSLANNPYLKPLQRRPARKLFVKDMEQLNKWLGFDRGAPSFMTFFLAREEDQPLDKKTLHLIELRTRSYNDEIFLLDSTGKGYTVARSTLRNCVDRWKEQSQAEWDYEAVWADVLYPEEAGYGS